ncbi:MAG: ChbG/HpnK family deacetylase [Alphaproteobacteria bacterium]|nr:ChbG/HpnK family deacetylase [Alphaproteobacteria bacterium]
MTRVGSLPIAVCADDYGIAPGTSRGIRELLAAGRLSGTSCLVLSPHWRDEAPALRGLAADADIGLHLAFTDFSPLGAMPRLAPQGKLPGIAALVLAAYRGRLDAAEIGQEVDRQFAAFAQAMGRAPDYVDGHQHVHQLPVIRDRMIERMRKHAPRAALRICDEPLGAIFRRAVAPFRAAVIAAMGGGLRRAADAAGIAGNRRFTGVRSFAEREPYRALFRRYIADAPPGLAIMCHPGHPDDSLRALDPVVATREDELSYFAGDEFPADLTAVGLSLVRFTALCRGSPRTSSGFG